MPKDDEKKVKKQTTEAKSSLTRLKEVYDELAKTSYDGWGFASKLFNGWLQDMGKLVSPFSKVQSAAIELAKAVGYAGSSIYSMSERMIAQNKALALSMNYNMSNEEMFRMQTQVLSKLGRNVAIDNVERVYKNQNGEVIDTGFGGSEIENLVAATKVFGQETVADLVAGFDRIGKSMNSAAKASGKVFKQAGEYGINLQKYTQNFVGNLEMAQKFNFRNGVKGLQEMARKATEIRQDMQQISRFAEKVGSVEGAIETASRLQVLGGSFASLANPLAMLNESLTNVEGLQDRFNKMTANAAYYDAGRREIRMDPVERLKLMRAAEAMGVDAGNLIDQAYAQARRGEIQGQMRGYGGFSDEVAKLLPNVGEIDNETGLAGATINGEFKTLGQIAASPELQKKLIEETRTESEDIKEIAKSVMGIQDLLEGRQKQMENEVAANKIKPGVLGGKSSVENVVSAIIDGYNQDLITAVGRIEFPIQNISEAWQTTWKGTVFDLTQSLAQNSWDDIFETLGVQLRESVADIDWSPVTDFIKDIPDFFQEKVYPALGLPEGFSLPDWLKENLGLDFVDSTMASITLPNASTVVVAPSPQAQPIAGNYTPSTYPWGGAVQDYSMRPSPVAPTFTYNPQTMPTATVSPTVYGGTQGTGTAAENGGTGEYSINLNGTLTMNVNGDNGRIGTIDIVKMLQDNPTMMEEVTKMIVDTIEKQEKAGARRL